MILALAGGVGGAKLASGLAGLLSPARLTVIGNTGDDFEHLGLHVSPDLDSLMYWLAGLNDTERGWGLADESWNFMSAIRRLQEPDWFNLGDRDLATHVVRTLHLGKGSALSAVTELLARRLGIAHRLAPMTDDRVRTILTTDRGRLEFQEYFVRHKCEPKIVAIEYSGADAARMTGAFRDALADPRLEAIVICPSNP
ncbi:MAG: 2-phospho-L-lactate transferase CofD family protein [Parvibaculaceae bacterium]